MINLKYVHEMFILMHVLFIMPNILIFNLMHEIPYWIHVNLGLIHVLSSLIHVTP